LTALGPGWETQAVSQWVWYVIGLFVFLGGIVVIAALAALAGQS
jgi:hypothetical protein